MCIYNWISWSTRSLYCCTYCFLYIVFHFDCLSTLKIGIYFYQFYTYSNKNQIVMYFTPGGMMNTI